MSTRFCITILFWAILSPQAHAAKLSAGLTGADVDRVVEVIGLSSTGRLLRSAEAYESWPGVKMGFEVNLVPGRNLNTLGDGTGTLNSITPSPRLYIAKGLFYDIELILNFFPPSEVNAIASFSAFLKHTFYQEQSSWLSGAFFLGLTTIDGFSGNYKGTNVEVGMVISRDYVRLKPFVGLSALFARGELGQGFVTGRNTSTVATLHAFAGAEFELPLNMSFQVDLFNLAFGGSLFIGKHF